MIIYRKDVAWLKPFVEASKGLVPIHRLHLISGFRVPLDRIEQSDGICTKYGIGYSISLRTFVHCFGYVNSSRYSATGYKRQYIAELLISLAHELAHLKYWEHTADHMELESKILRRFPKILRDKGITNTYTRRKPKWKEE